MADLDDVSGAPLLDRLQRLYDIAEVQKHRVVSFELTEPDFAEFLCILRAQQERYPWVMDVEFAATPVHEAKDRSETTAMIAPQ